jgi:hypothetical protein
MTCRLLAASIAANGLLQNLVVQAECKDGKPTGYYLVNVGDGRPYANQSVKGAKQRSNVSASSLATGN